MGYACFDKSARILFNNNGLIYTNIPIVIDIFYGVSSYARVDEDIIKSTFLTATLIPFQFLWILMVRENYLMRN